jgi:hypothetical protein
MVEDLAVSPEHIKQVAKKALIIERYILERAWGLCYAIAALETGLSAFLPVILQAAGFASSYGLAARLGVNLSVSILGMAAAIRVFKKAYDAMLVRREIATSFWARMLKPWRSAVIWVIYVAPILAALFLLRPHVLAFLLGVLFATVFPFFFGLKVSFPEGLPREGIFVLVSYALCTLGSLILSLLSFNYTIYLAIWAVMVAVFLSASLYARTRKPSNLQEVPSSW